MTHGTLPLKHNTINMSFNKRLLLKYRVILIYERTFLFQSCRGSSESILFNVDQKTESDKTSTITCMEKHIWESVQEENRLEWIRRTSRVGKKQVQIKFLIFHSRLCHGLSCKAANEASLIQTHQLKCFKFNRVWRLVDRLGIFLSQTVSPHGWNADCLWKRWMRRRPRNAKTFSFSPCR